MFKRRARLLFVDPSDAGKALSACRIADRLGCDWLEGRAICLADGVKNNEQLWQWADLVIYLENAPRAPLPLAQHTRLRCWALPTDESWHITVSKNIQGVIGGLRMLARVDGGAVPPA